MKKLCIFLVLVAMSVGFYACQKDNPGIYNPKMKINKIYNEEGEHYLLEQWTWNSDMLAQVDFYRKNGDIKNTHRYFYTNNRLDKIEDGDEHTEFEYDGKLLKTIKTYSGEQLVETYDLTYNNKKKLSHISIQKPSKNNSGSSFLSHLFPDGGRSLEQFVSKRGVKAESYNFSSAEVDCYWEGDNIINMKMRLARPDSIQKLTFSYVYDDNVNPLCGFLALYVDHQILTDHPQYSLFSKNNTLSVSVTNEFDVFSETTSYTYSYDYYKKFPTKMYSTFVNRETLQEDSTLIFSYIYQY